MDERNEARKFTFRKRHRLSGSRRYQYVFEGGCRKNAGPISVFGVRNDLGFMRLGLSVSRRVGNAVKRNRIKRLIREAFRLQQHDWPGGYDLVVVVRPHGLLTLAEYQKLLFRAGRGIHNEWVKRAMKSASSESKREAE